MCAMTRKEVKNKLKSSCRGVLNDLLVHVGFTTLEKEIFRRRYIDDAEDVLTSCYDLFISPCTYNKIHNNILDKVSSYFSFIN